MNETSFTGCTSSVSGRANRYRLTATINRGDLMSQIMKRMYSGTVCVFSRLECAQEAYERLLSEYVYLANGVKYRIGEKRCYGLLSVINEVNGDIVAAAGIIADN
jgi:hypothetical protein